MNAKILAVVVVLCLAAVAWWFFASGGDHLSPQGGPGSSGDGAAKAAAAEQGKAVEGAKAADAGNGNVRTAVDPAPATGAATLALRGRLVDKQGQPQAGLEVALLTWRSDFDSMPLESIAETAGREDRRPKATSAADGRFEFHVASGIAGVVSLPADKRVLQKGEVQFAKVTADTNLGDIVVLMQSVVSGVVQDGRGQPVADVKVRAGYEAIGFGESSSATTDAQGRFRITKLRGGNLWLRTASAKFLPQVARVDVGEEQEKQDVVLTLEQGNAIAGQVVDDRGVPIGGVKVGAKRKEQRAGMSMERFTPDEATETDKNGWFLLAGLQGEAADVRAWGKGYAAAAERGVPVPSGNLLLHLSRTGTISGMLKSADGKPIAGSRVSASARQGADGEFVLAGSDLDMPLNVNGAQATTAEDGTFTIADVEPGTLTVRARGKAHRPVERRGVVMTPALAIKDVALVADLGATARVKVTDDAGKPVAGAKVSAAEKPAADPGPGGFHARRVTVDGGGGGVQVSGPGSVLASATTDNEGVAELPGLPAGVLQVVAKHDALADSKPADVTMPSSGVVEAALTLRRPGWAQVRVFDPSGTAVAAAFRVHGPLSGEAAQDHTGNYDATDNARIGPLAPGDYFAEVQATPKGRAFGGGGATFVIGGETLGLLQSRVQFSVTAGQDTVVDLKRPILTRITGRVTGADGPVAGCTVELEKKTVGAGEQGDPDLLPAGSTRTDEQGEYSLSDVQAGHYELKWGRPEQMVKAHAEFDVVANTAELRKDLDLRAGKVKVKVVNKADGEPIEGAEVELVEGASTAGPAPRQRRTMMISMSVNNDGTNETTTMSSSDQHAKTDVDGVAEVADVPPGIYTLRVSHDKHVTFELKDQAVVEKQVADCGRVEMDQAGRIRGRVLGADGRPVGMALVECRALEGGGEPQREPAMGGTFTFNGLKPGRYAVRAQPLGDGPSAFGAEVEVQVTAGRTPVAADVSLPK